MTSSGNTKSSYERTRHTFFRVWTVIGVVIILIGCGYLLGQVWTSISIILFSAFLVFVLRVPVAWMQKKRIPRALGAALSYLVALLVVAVVLLILLPALIEQFIGLVSSVPGYIEIAQDTWQQLYAQYYEFLQDSTIQELLKGLASNLSSWATGIASDSANMIVNMSKQVANALIVTGVSIIVGFWVLKDLPRISREVNIIIGPRYRDDAQVIVHAFSRALGGYLKGMVVASFCTGTMAGIAYYVIGLPYPVVLGILTGLMTFIPFLGPWIAGFIVAFLGLFISPLTALLAIIFTIVAQQITDNFISPRVMSEAVELHPSMILVFLFAGAALGGIFGMICAIPLTAAAKTIFVYYFEKNTGRQIVSLKGALFRGKQPEESGSEAYARVMSGETSSDGSCEAGSDGSGEAGTDTSGKTASEASCEVEHAKGAEEESTHQGDAGDSGDEERL